MGPAARQRRTLRRSKESVDGRVVRDTGSYAGTTVDGRGGGGFVFVTPDESYEKTSNGN